MPDQPAKPDQDVTDPPADWCCQDGDEAGFGDDDGQAVDTEDGAA